MSRHASLLLLIVVCGCSQNGGDHLSKDERERWDRLRAEAAGGGGFYVAGYFQSQKYWKMPGAGNEWVTTLPVVKLPGGKTKYHSLTLEQAKRDIMPIAKSPHITSAVLLDLYSQPNPRIVSWHYNDGATIREVNQPPVPELEESVRAFLQSLQKSAP